MPNTPPMGLMRYFQIKTIAPPDTMPAIAPGSVVRFQNRAQITSGPKAAPKPAHANETMPNTELSGLRAIIIPRIAMPITVRRAASMLFFSDILRWNASRSMFSDTLEAVVELITMLGPLTGQELNVFYRMRRNLHGWPVVAFESPRKRAAELVGTLLVVVNEDARTTRGIPAVYGIRVAVVNA